jgi:hypothetical protein
MKLKRKTSVVFATIKRQYNSQKQKGQKDKQNTTQNTKNWATPTPLITGGELICSGRVYTWKVHNEKILYILYSNNTLMFTSVEIN